MQPPWCGKLLKFYLPLYIGNYVKGPRLIAVPNGNNDKDIGKSAGLVPKFDMTEYGTVSTTERVWVCDEGLVNQSRLKIQSTPFERML